MRSFARRRGSALRTRALRPAFDLDRPRLAADRDPQRRRLGHVERELRGAAAAALDAREADHRGGAVGGRAAGRARCRRSARRDRCQAPRCQAPSVPGTPVPGTRGRRVLRGRRGDRHAERLRRRDAALVARGEHDGVRGRARRRGTTAPPLAFGEPSPKSQVSSTASPSASVAFAVNDGARGLERRDRPARSARTRTRRRRERTLPSPLPSFGGDVVEAAGAERVGRSGRC